ncbi:MAG: 4-hydroxy-3-methylbut-2-enyl diphosphate reductase, partial [Actinomycetota bacterium]|nr:4-hydroxy-3-methylbut-2-enyl diphosphate reductase [Actinomycetota bacterium]
DFIINKNNGMNKIYTMGPMIHNPKVIENYKKRGVCVLSNISSLKPEDIVVIRSHGVAPEIISILKEKKAKIVDATCPYVLKVHNLAKHLSEKGYYIVLTGDKNHPEVIGIAGNIGNKNYVIVDSVEESAKISPQKKIAVLSQTTQTYENFKIISKEIAGKVKDEVLIKNTTCKATELRQKEVADIAGKADIMIIVGGKNSANTTHLAEISKNIQTKTYHIEDAGDLKQEWFKNVKVAGISGGSSTPREDIKEVGKIIKSF